MVFKSTQKEPTDREKQNEGFKVNHILKNAREGSETTMHSNHSIKVMGNVNRAQLTPLKIETYDRVKDAVYESTSDKKRKPEKLSPI